jgi:hypothetical protein
VLGERAPHERDEGGGMRARHYASS